MVNLQDVQLWHIYHVDLCHHVKPKPKPKFVLAVAIVGDKVLAFMINSRISAFIRNKPELLVCEAAIVEKHHRWLSHDSFVDCRDLYDFYAWDFNSHRGEISAEAKKSVLAAVRSCPTLKRKDKRMILRNGGARWDDI